MDTLVAFCGGKREQWNYGDERVYAGYQNQIGRKNARAINEAGKERHENRKQTSTVKLLTNAFDVQIDILQKKNIVVPV